MSQARKQILVLWAVACLAKPVVAPWLSDSTLYGQELATAERLQKPGWWPTKGAFARSDYLGPQACAQCHSSEAETQGKTPMAHAGGRAEDSAILRDREHLSFHLGPYVYEIVHAGSETTFWVSDRTHSITVPLGWAFGEGEVGQTFLFERGGTYYEGHLSFFPVLSPLDVTPGHDHSMLLDLDQALGRRMDADETQRCFGCHTTASTLRHGFTQEVPTWRFLLAEEMDGLDRLVRRIATLPGQRTILLIASHGFFCMGCWAEKVADDALRAKVVISTLDAAGLPVLLRETDAAWSPAPGSESGRVIGDMHMADFTMRFHLSGLMSWFAATTGGEFFRNHNDLERGFEKLLAGPEVYYVLEFHPRTSSTMEDGTL